MTPENPFANSSSGRAFVETTGAGELLRRLDEGLGAREPFLLVTGEPGTGKSTLAREAVTRWGSQVAAAFVTFPSLSGEEMLAEICRRFGAEPPDGGRSKLIACFERRLAEVTANDRIALLVVDDAHSLPAERLEELRLLANTAQQEQRAFEVMLVGLTALEGRLEEPALQALRERIAVRARLAPLGPGDVRRYLHHRVSAVGGDGPGWFSRRTCREIADRTQGMPRRVNALAAEAMRIARGAGEKVVSPDHVKAAARNLGGAYLQAAASQERDEPAEAATSAAESAVTAPAAKPAAKPAASPSVPAPAPPVRAGAPPAPEPAPAPAAAPLRSQDPSEWVARFVGEQGPVRIGARSLSEPAWIEDPVVVATDSAGAEAKPRKPAKPAPGAPRPRSRSGGSKLPLLTAALVAVLGIATAVVLVPRMVRETPAPTVPAEPAATVEEDVPAETEEAPAPEEAEVAVADADAAPETAPAEPEAAPPSGPFTLEVASGLDFELALERRAQLQELTGFEGWVTPDVRGSSGEYRVVLGIYSTLDRASRAADMLVNSQTLAQVSVVALPPRRTRQ